MSWSSVESSAADSGPSLGCGTGGEPAATAGVTRGEDWGEGAARGESEAVS